MNLFELEGDLRYIALFILALIPLLVAFQQERKRRGWTLVVLGNLVLVLTLLLPATAAAQLLAEAETFFEEGTRISNPRIFTSAAIAMGLLGGYIITFGGVRDLVAEKVSQWQRVLASFSGLFVLVLLLLGGSFDIYSILVEFSQRGETLGQRFIEHFVFVAVSLFAGLVIGIALGLWAARDERAEDFILYTVGIIQTIPSLALFGVLLVPLARLGDRTFINIAQFIILMAIVAGLVLALVLRIQPNLPKQGRIAALVASAILLAIPLGLLAILLITFVFEATLNVFVDQDLRDALALVVVAFIAIPFLLWLDRRLDHTRNIRLLRLTRYGLLLGAGLGFVGLFIVGAQQVIGNNTLQELTVRDLGISGIGTAPAIIALTLYSLLPLVRNTYAGLKNVDEAIIDSGRGMGMTPSQIFFQIELPLAFPVIMAGVRNAGISLVGIAAVASIIGAGALGDFILLGVNTTSVDLILLGAIPAIVLAVVLDALLQVLEGIFTSPGLQQT